MWGYDSCFFWVTIEVSLQCTTNSSRARKTYSASNEKSDLGDIDFDLRCLECSFGRFTTYRDPAKWRELERTRFSRLQQCWTLLEWILLDHIRSTDPLSKSITVLADSVRHRGSMCTTNSAEMIYLFVSICGYLYTGCYTCGNVLLNFSQDDACPPDLIQQNLMKHWKRRPPI
jgi:hypothetical protein